MTNEEFRAALWSYGYAFVDHVSPHSDLWRGPDGFPRHVPNPDSISFDERKAFMEMFKFREGIVEH